MEELNHNTIGWISEIQLRSDCGRSEQTTAVRGTLSGHDWDTSFNYLLLDHVDKLMRDAQVKELSQLKFKPVVVTWEKGALKSWRIMTEVIPKS